MLISCLLGLCLLQVGGCGSGGVVRVSFSFSLSWCSSSKKSWLLLWLDMLSVSRSLSSEHKAQREIWLKRELEKKRWWFEVVRNDWPERKSSTESNCTDPLDLITVFIRSTHAPEQMGFAISICYFSSFLYAPFPSWEADAENAFIFICKWHSHLSHIRVYLYLWCCQQMLNVRLHKLHAWNDTKIQHYMGLNISVMYNFPGFHGTAETNVFLCCFNR